MNSAVSIRLNITPEQSQRLRALQIAFAEVCNALVPTVRETRIWNRVTLHHMAYKDLRERFPALGSQMVCNAIYSVSRSCRMVFQTPGSPFHLSVLGNKPLPMMRFMDTSPVYFDRHTLSLKAGQISMYTLDGRMRFHLTLEPHDERAFHERKLVEIILKGSGDAYSLNFRFGDAAGAENVVLATVNAPIQPQPTARTSAETQAKTQAETQAIALLEPGDTPSTAASAANNPPKEGIALPDYVLIEESA
jgi:hypothetical protein